MFFAQGKILNKCSNIRFCDEQRQNRSLQSLTFHRDANLATIAISLKQGLDHIVIGFPNLEQSLIEFLEYLYIGNSVLKFCN